MPEATENDSGSSTFPHHNGNDADNYTVTSQGYIWAYPGQYGSEVKTIAVLPTPAMKLENFYGICSDDFTQFEI